MTKCDETGGLQAGKQRGKGGFLPELPPLKRADLHAAPAQFARKGEAYAAMLLQRAGDGGGQVVVPLMYSELVEISKVMTNQEFLTGYGLVQGLPGPMFSFGSHLWCTLMNLGCFSLHKYNWKYGSAWCNFPFGCLN